MEKEIEKEMEKEIVTKILEIPLNEWVDYKSIIKGKTVTLHVSHSDLPKFFVIDGISFVDDRISGFKNKLDLFYMGKQKKDELTVLDKIYNLLCK